MSSPDAAWQLQWDARLRALEKLLGKSEDNVFHAMLPFHLGGFADVVWFRPRGSAVYVTADLLGPSGQKPSPLGQYELMIALREPADWAPSLISRLARYTTEAVLRHHETMDIGPALPKGSDIAALLFLDFARLEFWQKPAGLLLCLGIRADEMKYGRKHGNAALEELLKSKRVYPFTDLKRASVVDAS